MNLVYDVQFMNSDYIPNLYANIRWKKLSSSEQQQFQQTFDEKSQYKNVNRIIPYVPAASSEIVSNSNESVNYDYDKESNYYA